MPATSLYLPPLKHWLPAAVVLSLIAVLAIGLSDLEGGTQLSLSVLFGAAFGVLLQRSRFCFYCVTRDFLEWRDARGLLGIVAALAVGTLGYHALFGAFLPSPEAGRMPPGAHIGPVSWVLAAGAFSFGVGMAISGSCISAHLYRLGEGALAAPVALLGAAGGFVLGFITWNTLYLHSIQEAPVLWLPHHLGYAGSSAVQTGLLAALALLLAYSHRTTASNIEAPWWQRRWPTYAGGILIGMLAVIAYLRVAPLGVTAELGSLARTAADQAGWLPSRMEGLDGFAGCATLIKQTLWSNNGAFVFSLVLGSFAAALFAGDFRLQKPGAAELGRALVGGLLMGWGAMVALGCTIGVLLSGIMAAAVSGWVFAFFALIGLYAGWRFRRALEPFKR